MIGPGTGVVPFIGFMQEREMIKQANNDIQFAESFLFFGCRKEESDFIYKEEILKFKEDGIIRDSFIALSR